MCELKETEVADSKCGGSFVPCIAERSGRSTSGKQDALAEARDEQCVESLLEWLQVCLVSKRRLSWKSRLGPLVLVDIDFIASVVEELCPAVFAAQVGAINTAGDIDDTMRLALVAASLDAEFLRARQGHVEGAVLLRHALRAGANDMEPLRDVVHLWRHILTYAVICEDHVLHIDSILELPSRVQADIMESIQVVEQQLSGCVVATDPPFSDAQDSTPLKSQLVRIYCDDRLSSGTARRASDVYTPRSDSPGRVAVDALVFENDKLRGRVQELSKQVERDRHARKRTDTLLDGELEAFERSWSMEKIIQQKDDEINELSGKVRAAARAFDEHQEVLGEVLVLRAREQEHAALRAKFDRATQRLEELAEVRAALRASKQQTTDTIRERDFLLQELGQMKGVGQQLDAWKAKVHELELRCKDAEGMRYSADLQANDCKVAEAVLRSEKSALEEQLQEASLQLAFLKEQGPGHDDGIIEPFTEELREKMVRLEARNTVLEQQLTSENTQRVAQLVVEVETLRNLKEHFEAAFNEVSAKLQHAEDTAAQTISTLKLAGIAKVEAESIVSTLGETIGCLEDERDDALDLLASQREHLQALFEVSEKYRESAEKSSEDLGTSRAQVRHLSERCSELDCREQRQQRAIEELRRRTEGVYLSSAVQARAQAELRERDEVWTQRQGVLEEGFKDLHLGMLEQVKHIEALKEQADMAEVRCGRFEESLRRVAPAEFEVLHLCRDQRQQALSVPGAGHDLVRARGENRRLNSQLAEQRLKTAQESQQVAQLSAQLRRLQRSLDLHGVAAPWGSLESDGHPGSNGSGPRVAFAAESANAFAPASPEREPSPLRPPLRELHLDRCIFQEVGTAPTATEKLRLPRSSILKKSKLLDSTDSQDGASRKENLGAARFATLPCKPAHRTPRAGLLT